MICTLVAGAVTGGAYFFLDHRNRVEENTLQLQFARQIAAQAEGLALAAKEKGEADPIAWAVHFLTQGPEPRVFHVSNVNTGPSTSATENYALDHDNGTFDYTKILFPETGRGIQVQSRFFKAGFLGAHTKLENDFSVGGLFSGLWLILFLGSASVFGLTKEKILKRAILEWIAEAKPMLTGLGTHIRDLVKNAQQLAAATGKSRRTITTLRDDIHSKINDMKKAREHLIEAEEIAAVTETHALNAVIEATRLGDPGKHIAEVSEELHKLVQKFRSLSRKSDTLVQQLEFKLEPWSTNADQAFHSYDDVHKTTEELDGTISKTTDSLMNQAKLVQTLSQRLASKK